MLDKPRRSLRITPQPQPAARRRPRRLATPAVPLALALAAGLTAGGCQLFGFVAAVQRDMPRTVQAEYLGLDGHSFGVVVRADRVIQADYPGLVRALTVTISDNLADFSQASDYARPDLLLAHLADRPRWVTWSPAELSADLGVERLVLVDVEEYRLNDPGNRYVWQGQLSARVSVYEAGSALPDDPAFDRFVTVRYPDKDGYTEADMSGVLVGSALVSRFTDRACWFFYDHKEDGDIPY